MKVLIAAGGSGGHIYPGITIATTLLRRDRNVDVLFVGREEGLEARLVPEAGFRFASVEATYLQRKLSFSLFKTAWVSLKGLRQSAAIIKRFQPDVALGTGGYVSGPVIAAAKWKGIPTVIQEADASPGLTSRLLGRYVDTVALGSSEAVKHFGRAKRVEVTGNPIRSDIVTRPRGSGYKAFGLDPRRKTVLVFGGSQGGATLNEAAMGAVQALLRDGVQMIWQTGPAGYAEAVASLTDALEQEPTDASSGVRFGRLHVLPFIDDMAGAYSAADVVVCRAGAITVAELTARGLPALLVPYPYAAQGHQLANARVVEQAGGARVILDADLDGPALVQAVQRLLGDPDGLQRMADASRRLGRPDAAERIADLVLSASAKKSPS